MCHIDALQGNNAGAKVSLVAALFEQHIKAYLDQHPSFDTANDHIQIKINGDSAKMTRNSNLFFFPFQFYKQENK